MSQWLVSNLPSWLLLLGVITVVAGGAVLIQRIVRRRFTNLKGEEHNDVIKFAFGVIGFVFAFFVGFVVSAMWGQIGDADGRARSEGAAGVQLVRDASVFEQADKTEFGKRCSNTSRPHWSNGTKPRRAIHTPRPTTRCPDSIRRTTASKRGRTPRRPCSGASFSSLDTLSQARTQRVLQARSDVGPPWSLWAVIWLTSGLLIGCAIIYGVEKPATHYTMVAILGVLVATNIFLVLELSHPFIGEIGTSSEPLHQVVRLLTWSR